ncbi:hypothetical protein [Variovorax sp. dw_308]|uniref:hypothetical protein n=1 Tax=Variovorax sp. dw_308 TaxID=2721546 RepID=UPI001C456E28|nr:hypothetical protein [Variovorax sp. dw_308]
MAMLNHRTDYRYTGLFNLRGAGMCPTVVFDRTADSRTWHRLVPLRASIWRHMLRQGEFTTSCASEDSRLSRSDPLNSLESCCGSLLQPNAGALPCGVLIHFDVQRRSIDPGEVSMLRRTAPLFLTYLALSE